MLHLLSINAKPVLYPRIVSLCV